MLVTKGERKKNVCLMFKWRNPVSSVFFMVIYVRLFVRRLFFFISMLGSIVDQPPALVGWWDWPTGFVRSTLYYMRRKGLGHWRSGSEATIFAFGFIQTLRATIGRGYPDQIRPGGRGSGN